MVINLLRMLPCPVIVPVKSVCKIRLIITVFPAVCVVAFCVVRMFSQLPWTPIFRYYPNANSNTANVQSLFKDRMGSTVAITNDEGKLLKRFSYDAFGQQSEIAPTAAQRTSYCADYLTLNPLTQIYH